MKILEVSSPSNPTYRTLESLLKSRGIKSEGMALISGKRIVRETLESPSLRPFCQELIFDHKIRDYALELAGDTQMDRMVSLTSPLFSILDELGTKSPILTLKIKDLESFSSPVDGLNVFLALSDPLNLGAALRTLEAFSASQVVLLKECAHPFLPKVTKSSSGSNLRMTLVNGPSIQELSVSNGVALDRSGSPIQSYNWDKTSSLVLGEEGLGLPEGLKKTMKILSIPIAPQVESLNATVALSIACFSFRQNHPL